VAQEPEIVEEDEPAEEECPKCPPVGAPAWMATFADMATLLMAFFRFDFIVRRIQLAQI
jgi:chemotaxis protein MotB